MPLYVCNSQKGTIPDEAKPKIADDITRIHCEVTGAPPTFVHAFFFEEADHAPPLGDAKAFVFGSIRAGRTDEQREDMIAQMRRSVCKHAGLSFEDTTGLTVEVPASWIMEGGDILPEPGEEAEWLEMHEAKKAAARVATAAE